MAATAVYSDVLRVPVGGGIAGNKFRVSNSDKVDTAFPVVGGVYMISCKASTYGTVALQVLCADGLTWVTVSDIAGNAVSFSADGSKQAYLAQGTYRVHAA